MSFQSTLAGIPTAESFDALESNQQAQVNRWLEYIGSAFKNREIHLLSITSDDSISKKVDKFSLRTAQGQNPSDDLVASIKDCVRMREITALLLDLKRAKLEALEETLRTIQSTEPLVVSMQSWNDFYGKVSMRKGHWLATCPWIPKEMAGMVLWEAKDGVLEVLDDDFRVTVESMLYSKRRGELWNSRGEQGSGDLTHNIQDVMDNMVKVLGVETTMKNAEGSDGKTTWTTAIPTAMFVLNGEPKASELGVGNHLSVLDQL